MLDVEHFHKSPTSPLMNEITSGVLTYRKHRRTHSDGQTALGVSSKTLAPFHLPEEISDTPFDNGCSDDGDIGDDSSAVLRGLLKPSHRRSASYGGSGRAELISREISEVASRVVEQAEELVMHLWEQGWRVVHHTSLPHWLRDNDYLIWGHRPPLTSFQACFKSIFRIHTETVNIWTHLIGFVAFLALCVCFLGQPGFKYPWQEKAVISVFFASAILALGFSWLFHTVHCHSESVGIIFNKLDYIGIALLTIGSFVPWLHYSFYCNVPSKIVYLSCIIILGLICIIISTKDRFRTPNYRGVRAGLFIALGLSGVVPCLHYTIMEGFWETIASSSLGWLLLMAFLYISGAIIYALRIPERLYPGKFDIWSHQIFHVFVVLAALAHLHGILEIAETRLSQAACGNT